MSLRTSVSRGVVGVLSVSIATAFLVAPSHHHLPSAPLRSSVGEGPLAGMFKKTLGAVAGLGKPTGSAELSGMVDGAPSWEALGEMLREQQTEEEREFRSNLASGRGEVSQPLASIRMFDAPDGTEPRVTFFRDHAAWCPYCHKVWLTLEEKRIPYRVEKVPMSCYGKKPAEFSRMQPSGQIPVAIIDGEVFRQSNDIIFHLEENFEGHPLVPDDDLLRSNVNQLLRLEREFFGAWLGWLTARGGPGSGGRRVAFENSLQRVEEALGATAEQGPYFLGAEVSLVDIMFAPFLERAAASLVYFKGFTFRGAEDSVAREDYPNVNKWFDAMESRPAYQGTKSDYYTHAHDLPPQLGGCGLEAQAFADSLDGKSGDWNLPLSPGTLEPDWGWYDEGAARREAAERLVHNHAAIARFAARGAGKQGMPPVMAPLADPNAVPDDSVVPAVDVMLRWVCHALLSDTGSLDDSVDQSAASLGGVSNEVVASLTYLKDRVGVPRDMQLPAARQLRGHLMWASGKF